MSEQNEKQQIQLAPNALQLFEHVSLQYDAVIQEGVKPTDLLEPAFWAHHAVKLRPMNEIRARAEDGTWVGYFLVLDCSRTWAKVHLLALHHLTTADVALTQASEEEIKSFIDAHNVTFRGQHKWSIVRKLDKAVLHEGVEQKDTAAKWLAEHARATVGAKPAPKPVAATA